MRLVTLNVRNPSFDDGPNAWPHRRERFYETLRALVPDVLCLQETIESHAEEVRAALGFRAVVGLPREADGTGEMCAILHRSERVVDEGTEWLSPTPTVPGSMGWDACCTRVVTWVDFGEWAVLNTHFDHISLEARTQGMAQVLRKADGFGKPSLIAGDFNATPDEPAIALALEAGFVDLAEGTGATFHGFGVGETVRIDYVLARGPWRCERAWVERGAYSDHDAVAVEVAL